MSIHDLALKACDRLNNRDLVLLANSTDTLNDNHIAIIESYEEFKYFQIIEPCTDVDGRETLFMLHVEENIEVVIEKDNGMWRVLG